MTPTSLRSRSIKARRNQARVSELAEEVKCISFQLPAMPPPLSACFNNFGRRRIESKRYATWKRATDEYCAYFWKKALGDELTGPTIPGEVRVRYYVKRPDRRTRDLDNLCKALNDTLTRLRVIEDDSNIVDLGIAWTSSNTFDGAVLVEIESVNGCRKIETEAAA